MKSNFFSSSRENFGIFFMCAHKISLDTVLFFFLSLSSCVPFYCSSTFLARFDKEKIDRHVALNVTYHSNFLLFVSCRTHAEKTHKMTKTFFMCILLCNGTKWSFLWDIDWIFVIILWNYGKKKYYFLKKNVISVYSMHFYKF